MKLKILDYVTIVLAIIGIIICIGAVGRMDYDIMYPLSSTLKTILLGLWLCVPEYIRRIR